MTRRTQACKRHKGVASERLIWRGKPSERGRLPHMS
jgi:hypothetical protein